MAIDLRGGARRIKMNSALGGRLIAESVGVMKI
jgi:hypothetical protein